MLYKLTKVRLDQGGYDSRGQYWGPGLPLYEWMPVDGSQWNHLRAVNRDEAKQAVRALVAATDPNPRFWH